MELSHEVMCALNFAVSFASNSRFEYITPEMLLLGLCRVTHFSEAFTECGGDTKKLHDDLLSYTAEFLDNNDDVNPEMSEGTKQVMEYATQSAYSSGCDMIHIRHLIRGLWQLHDSYAVYFMQRQGILESDILRELTIISQTDGESVPAASMGKGSLAPEESRDQAQNFTAYAPCLNDNLKDVNPLIGREAELERTIQILCRKDKNNPLHIGEAGVGKTAITYGLVQRINQGSVPAPLRGARIFALDLGGMVAGTQYRGDFEKRLKKVLSEISREEKPIIYIDEIHNLTGAGGTNGGSLDASNMLKPYLADGHIRFIGATTFEEYKKHFEKSKSLVRRFQNVEIAEPTESEAIEILEGLKEKYAKFHGVRYSRGLMEYAVHMSALHINERFLPDKAIDLIDEAGAYRKLHPTDKKIQMVDKAVINQVLTNICRVPVETVKTEDNDGLSTLENRLKDCIFGQDTAISQVVNAVKFSRAGLGDMDKPLGSLLFVGPTGVGKTEIAKTLAKELGIRLIRFDMSEYAEKHTVAKLIGSPAGYVGYEEGGLLTEEVRKSPSAVLLLDEIEKAHGDIYNILLQIMDYATLTDNQGRKADFRNIILIMTSNAGADQVGKAGIGFHTIKQESGAILDAVKRTFQPEFRNRLNKIVVFNFMDDAMAGQIVEKKIREMSLQLSSKNIEITFSPEALNLLIKQGITPEFGAREVDRIIRNDIKPLFVDDILFGKLKKGGCISVFVKDGDFSVKINTKQKN